MVLVRILQVSILFLESFEVISGALKFFLKPLDAVLQLLNVLWVLE